MTNKTILISGSCGFIGSHLCDHYLKKKFNVIGIDNLLTGSLSNISHLEGNKNFRFFELDVCHKIKIESKIDYILHFASTASPIDYLKFPIKTLQIGSVGTENILKLAIKNDASVLLASTSEVYGDPLQHPQKESYFGNVNPIRKPNSLNVFLGIWFFINFNLIQILVSMSHLFLFWVDYTCEEIDFGVLICPFPFS